MRRTVPQSIGRARFKFVNGLVFIVLGLFIIAEFVHALGLRFEAISGYVLGAALIGLGVHRLRMGWPRP